LDQLHKGGQTLSEVLLHQFDLSLNKTNRKQAEEKSLYDEAFTACLRISINFVIDTSGNSAEKDLHDA